MLRVKLKPFRRYDITHNDKARWSTKIWQDPWSIEEVSKKTIPKSIGTVIMHQDSISFAPFTFSIFSIKSSFHAIFASSNRTKAFVACWCAATSGSRQTCRGTMAVPLGSPHGQRCTKARKASSSELSLSQTGENFHPLSFPGNPPTRPHLTPKNPTTTSTSQE